MKPWPSGAKMNWPTEPAAVPRPKPMVRMEAGNRRAKAAITSRKAEPAMPRPTSTPAVSCSATGVPLWAISARPSA